jgi:hypothetical protein
MANIAIQSSLLRDDLVLRAEVFVVPAGPGYTVIIGKTDAKATLSDKEKQYIYDEVRRILIEAKLEREKKTSSNDPANQAPLPTTTAVTPAASHPSRQP